MFFFVIQNKVKIIQKCFSGEHFTKAKKKKTPLQEEEIIYIKIIFFLWFKIK